MSLVLLAVEETMSRKILIADGSPTIRNVAESLLKKHGYEVFSAKDGVEALRLAKTHRPDIAFLDDSMPVLNGEQVLKEFRQEKNLEDVPVVMLLSRDEADRRRQLKQSGTDSFIAKPLNPAQIINHVEKVLSEKRVLSSADRSKPVGLPTEDIGNPDRVEQAEVTLPGSDEESGEGLDIVTNGDLMQSTDPSLAGSSENAAHGFEWFLDELKKEAAHEEPKVPLAGDKPGPNEQGMPTQTKRREDEGQTPEINDSEPGFEEFVRELKYDQGDAGDGKGPRVERSVIENMSPPHLDQLVSNLAERIPRRVAREVAEMVTPELLERIIREELARIRKHST